MKCVDSVERLEQLADGSLPELQRRQVVNHVESCESCRFALHGYQAMRTLRQQAPAATPAGLFEKVMAETRVRTETGRQRPTFWLGVSVGGAIAAAIAVVVVTLGSIGTPQPDADEIPVFTVAIGEPRTLHIAIDAAKDLTAATVSITLAGDINIDGFGDKRMLSWTTDLQKGVNKLTLPIVATDADVGQLVVKLDHPDARQEFRVIFELGT